MSGKGELKGQGVDGVVGWGLFVVWIGGTLMLVKLIKTARLRPSVLPAVPNCNVLAKKATAECSLLGNRSQCFKTTVIEVLPKEMASAKKP